MNISRRVFTTGAFTAAAFGGLAACQSGLVRSARYRSEIAGYGPLISDPERLLDLPAGFSYRILSRAGETMDDGFIVPDRADGMGCIALDGQRLALVRNHEMPPDELALGPTAGRDLLLRRLRREDAFGTDRAGLPLPGGTTTMIYDMRSGRIERQHLSLTGTVRNCAGGTTPWGSWLSCEESTLTRGDEVAGDHGWIFEVPAKSGGLAKPEPLRAMGRFNHEAAAVDPRTGIVYLTEDRDDGLFYRFLPATRGALDRGGRLQVLGFRDAAQGGDASNWNSVTIASGDWRDTTWIDLDHPESPADDLRLRGHAAGAVRFARGEGIHFGEGEFFFCCTSGGAAKLGQIMRYRPSRFEGQPGERDAPGRVQNFVESTDPGLLNFGDNLTVAPWGHLIVCEDQYSAIPTNHLRGVTPDGRLYTLARHLGRSELAGACFSPDGSTLFVNIYKPGKTLAITGPWRSFQSA